MPPEDNPADDVQPTREEWESYEAAKVPPCRICQSVKDVIVYPDDHSQAVCPDCCAKAGHLDGETSHQFDYDRGERHHVCRYCGIRRDCTDYRE